MHLSTHTHIWYVCLLYCTHMSDVFVSAILPCLMSVSAILTCLLCMSAILTCLLCMSAILTCLLYMSAYTHMFGVNVLTACW